MPTASVSTSDTSIKRSFWSWQPALEHRIEFQSDWIALIFLCNPMLRIIVAGGNTNAPAIMIGEKASDLFAGRTPLVSLEVPVYSPPV